LQLQFLKRN